MLRLSNSNVFDNILPSGDMNTTSAANQEEAAYIASEFMSGEHIFSFLSSFLCSLVCLVTVVTVLFPTSHDRVPPGMLVLSLGTDEPGSCNYRSLVGCSNDSLC